MPDYYCQCSECAKTTKKNPMYSISYLKTAYTQKFIQALTENKVCYKDLGFYYNVIRIARAKISIPEKLLSKDLFWPLVTARFPQINEHHQRFTLFRAALVARKYPMCDQLYGLALKHKKIIAAKCSYLKTSPISLLWYLLSSYPSIEPYDEDNITKINIDIRYLDQQEFISAFYIASRAMTDGTVELQMVNGIDPYENMKQFIASTKHTELTQAWLKIKENVKQYGNGLNKKTVRLLHIYSDDIEKRILAANNKKTAAIISKIIHKATLFGVRAEKLVALYRYRSCRASYWINSLYSLIDTIIDIDAELDTENRSQIEPQIKEVKALVRAKYYHQTKGMLNKDTQLTLSKHETLPHNTILEMMKLALSSAGNIIYNNSLSKPELESWILEFAPIMHTILNLVVSEFCKTCNKTPKQGISIRREMILEKAISHQLTETITGNRVYIGLKLNIARLIKMGCEQKLLFIIAICHETTGNAQKTLTEFLHQKTGTPLKSKMTHPKQIKKRTKKHAKKHSKNTQNTDLTCSRIVIDEKQIGILKSYIAKLHEKSGPPSPTTITVTGKNLSI